MSVEMPGAAAVRSLAVGDELPQVVRGPITRTTLALFAGASGDHVRLHIDSDYARAAGMDDVFAHGMLPMAYLAQVLTGWFRPEQLRRWSVRFLAITPLHAMVRCSAEVTAIFEEAGGRHARLRIRAVIDDETPTLDGEAVVLLDMQEER